MIKSKGNKNPHRFSFPISCFGEVCGTRTSLWDWRVTGWSQGEGPRTTWPAVHSSGPHLCQEHARKPSSRPTWDEAWQSRDRRCQSRLKSPRKEEDKRGGREDRGRGEAGKHRRSSNLHTRTGPEEEQHFQKGAPSPAQALIYEDVLTLSL